MDALFTVLDGAAALWLCLFSPRRYLLLVARTKLAARGARNYVEAYLRVNLVPALLAGSLFQFNATMESSNVDLLLQKENVRYGLQPGHLQTIYHQHYSQDQLINVMNFIQSKNMLSLSFFIGAMATYYSLSRSREFGNNWRRMRHALQFITMNALTILVLQVAPSAVQSVVLLSVDTESVELPLATTADEAVKNAMVAAQGLSDTSGTHIFLTVFVVALSILSAVVSIRILILLARSLHIGFWRSIWLQIRYALPVAIILMVLAFCLGLGLRMANLLVLALALLSLACLVVSLIPASREWVSRLVAPAPDRKIVKPRAARIRITQGALAGTVVPVATKIVLGRDPAQSAIVFPVDDTQVSRRHCEIRFDPKSGLFEVRDLGSRNGTFIFDGINAARRLPPDRTERIAPGQNVFLGSSRERLVLELV